jgi:WD40 repeat protein
MKPLHRFFAWLGGVALLTAAPSLLPAQSGPDVIWVTNSDWQAVTALSLSADSRFVACGGQPFGGVAVWNVASMTLPGNLDVGPTRAVALSTNGDRVAAGDEDGVVRMWRVMDSALLWKTDPSSNPVNSVAFSHAGDRLVETGGLHSDGKLVLRTASTGQGLLLDGATNIPAIYSANFSPDDSLVASGGEDQKVKLWRLQDPALVRTLSGHSNAVLSVDFSPDGTLLLSGGADGTARLWNVADGTVVRVIDGGGGLAKFSADGNLVLTLTDGTFKFWRAATGALVGSYPDTGAQVFDVARNGRYFAYGRDDWGVALAWMPLVVNEPGTTTNQTTLNWQGGSGRYQVQQSKNVTSGPWQDLGAPTTNASLSVTPADPIVFYRVLGLPNFL